MSSPQIEALKRRIAAIPKAARVEIAKALDASAAEMVASAKHLAPDDDGDLQSSIRWSQGETPLARVIEAGGPTTTRPVREGQSATYDYALAQEFGTEKMPAQPFFYPAYRIIRKRIVGRVRRAVSKAARTAAKGNP